MPPNANILPCTFHHLFVSDSHRLCHPESIYFPALFNCSTLFSIPVVPGQPGQSKSLLFKRNFNKNRYFSPSRPLPASPGYQNRYFLKGISIKIDTFFHPGRSLPARAALCAFQIRPDNRKSLLWTLFVALEAATGSSVSPLCLSNKTRHKEKLALDALCGPGRSKKKKKKRRFANLYIQTPDRPPMRLLCYLSLSLYIYMYTYIYIYIYIVFFFSKHFPYMLLCVFLNLFSQQKKNLV